MGLDPKRGRSHTLKSSISEKTLEKKSIADISTSKVSRARADSDESELDMFMTNSGSVMFPTDDPEEF